jgi:hypothetical protein
VGGDAVLYFDALNGKGLASQIELLWTQENVHAAMIEKGYNRVKQFSWDKCAQETTDYILA